MTGPIDPLDAYIRENHLRYSEPVLRQAAIAAGNSPEAVDAALARYRPGAPPPGFGRRAAVQILVAYLIVFAIVSGAMVVTAARIGGEFVGGVLLAIIVWAVVLAAGYGVSMIWVASRRVGLVIIGLVFALIGLALSGVGGAGSVITIVVGVAIAVAAFVYGNRVGASVSASTPVLLSVPLLILLALGGACVATGLPLGTS